MNNKDNEKKNLLSIIVPVYNTSEYLERCIQSICNQTYDRIEIIIVDDGSTDGSGKICDSWAKKDCRIKVFHKKNGGLSDARNYGIKIAQGKYIGFVDSDDYIEPDMYEVLIVACEKFDVLMSCCGRYDEYEKKTEKSFVLAKSVEWSAEEAICNLLKWNKIDSAAWDKVYRKELWDNIRYPYGEISEDVPITMKIIHEAGKIVHVGKPLYHYCHRPNSITTSEYSKKHQGIVEHAIQIGAWLGEYYSNLREEYEVFLIKEILYVMAIYQMSKRKTRKEYQILNRENKLILNRYKYILKENSQAALLYKREYLKIKMCWYVLFGVLLRKRKELKGC